MKSNSLLSGLFILIFSYSMNSQYHVDLTVCPASPNPVKYTLQHFNLKGSVKEYDDSITVYIFNEDGKLISDKGIYGMENKYIYDTKGGLIRIETDMYGMKLNNDITRDGGNRIIESSSNGVGHKFTYDAKGNYFEKYNLVDKMVTERHFYDAAGRVITSKNFFPIINTSSTKTYSYLKVGDYLLVNSKYTPSDKEKPPSEYTTYYKNGNYYGNSKNDNIKYDTYGNPLSYLDENGKISSPMKYKYFDGSSSGKNDSNKSDAIKPQSPSEKITSYCVSGDCDNGWGKYQYEDNHYEGFWSNGKKSGYGLYQWQGIGKYIGNWSNDTMNGYGVYIANNDDNTIGNFSNGQLDGLGLTVYSDKWSYGVFSNGNLKTNYDFYSNSLETGCVAGDCQNKYGRWKWANGDIYSGFFNNGKLLMGTYNFENGDRYTGMFDEDNKFHGTGRYFYKNGGYYGGDWVNGIMQGRGYYHDSSLEQQIGEWSNGSLIKSLKN